MPMTLKDWDAHGNPGVFTGPGFDCWRVPSVLDPSKEIFHLVITSGKSQHPFKNTYAEVTHQFSSFYGLRQYLGKSPADIEGEVDPSADTSRLLAASMAATHPGLFAVVEQLTNDMREEVRKERLLLVQNHRDASCGTSPHIDDSNLYQLPYYFESGQGYQLIFVYDRQSGAGRLYGGTTSWDEVLPVVGGEAESTMLRPVERAWLKVCWEAATGA